MSACTMNLLKLAQPVGIDQLSLTFDVPIKYRPTCKAKLYEVAAEYGYGSKVIEYPNSKNYRNSLYIPQFGNLFIQSEPCGRLKPRTEDNHGARWLKFKFNPNKVPDFAALRCLLRILLQQYYQNLNHHTVMTEIDFYQHLSRSLVTRF